MKPLQLRSIHRELLTVGVAAALVFTTRSSLADHYVVPSGSMAPTVTPEDRIFVDKLAYGVHVPMADAYAVRFRGPSAGEVVVLRSPEDGRVLLKRVVAVPGDRIHVGAGMLERNGEVAHVETTHDGALVEELGGARHPVRLDNGGGPDFGPITLPADKYLVMGDNRGDSHDGRMFGLVDRSAILGRAEGVFMRHGSPTWIGL